MSTVAISERKSTPNAKPVGMAGLEQLAADASVIYRKLVFDLVEDKAIDAATIRETLILAGRSPEQLKIDVAKVRERYVIVQEQAKLPAIHKQRAECVVKEKELQAHYAAVEKKCEAMLAEAGKPIQEVWQHRQALGQQMNDINRLFPARKLHASADPAIDERCHEIQQQINALEHNITGRRMGLENLLPDAEQAVAELPAKVEQLAGFCASDSAGPSWHEELREKRDRLARAQSTLEKHAANERQSAADRASIAKLEAQSEEWGQTKLDWRNVAL